MYYEDLTVGFSFTVPDVTVDREEMIAYSRRYNPSFIHVDEEKAAATPFGDVIASGSYTEAIVNAEIVKTGILTEHVVGGKSAYCEWKKPVLAGDVLSTRVTILDRHARHRDRGEILVGVDTWNQRGEPVMHGEMRSVVSTRSPLPDSELS